MDLKSLRMRIRIASGMVEDIKGNFKDQYRRRNKSLTCRSCKPQLEVNSEEKKKEKPVETQNHLLENCVAFEELRKSIELNSDSGLVSFFHEVVKLRIAEDENEE